MEDNEDDVQEIFYTQTDITRSSQLLQKLVKLFDSESLDIFLTSEFLFINKV